MCPRYGSGCSPSLSNLLCAQGMALVVLPASPPYFPSSHTSSVLGSAPSCFPSFQLPSPPELIADSPCWPIHPQLPLPDAQADHPKWQSGTGHHEDRVLDQQQRGGEVQAVGEGEPRAGRKIIAEVCGEGEEVVAGQGRPRLGVSQASRGKPEVRGSVQVIYQGRSQETSCQGVSGEGQGRGEG